MSVPELQDGKVVVNLEVLASVPFTPPVFKSPSSFAIKDLVYLGDMSSIFSGTFDGEPALIETCTRIPFRVVCRELKIIADLESPGLLEVLGTMKNPSLGVISIAYRNFPFILANENVPHEKLPRLFLSLLKTLAQIHEKNIAHNWICRTSVYIDTSMETVKLGSMHAATPIDTPEPLIPIHPCAPKTRADGDRRPDDVYSAALWFLSFYLDDPSLALETLDELKLDDNLKTLVRKMTTATPSDRITAEDAANELETLI